MRFLLSTFLLIMLSSGAQALNDFKCSIKDAVDLEDDGTLNHRSNTVSGYSGKEFVKNRQTGIITGADLMNTMSGQMPTAYDYVPFENGYKAVTHYEPDNTIAYLEIRQYSASKGKPFFFKGAFGEKLSGTCVVF